MSVPIGELVVRAQEAGKLRPDLVVLDERAMAKRLAKE